MLNPLTHSTGSSKTGAIGGQAADAEIRDRPELLQTPFSPRSAYSQPLRSEVARWIAPCLVAASFIGLVTLAVHQGTAPPPSTADLATAQAALQPTTGNTTTGVVNFHQQRDGKVRVEGTISGLKPNARHGFHIHEKGTCNSADGKNDGTGTGGHFKLPGQDHGHAGTQMHHAGDLPELVSDASGQAKFQVLVDGITIEPGERSIDGRGLIVHANPDDGATQPTGNAGARIACGTIQKGPTDLLQHQGGGAPVASLHGESGKIGSYAGGGPFDLAP